MRPGPARCDDDDARRSSTPRHEAAIVFGLVDRGVETLAAARALIEIPPRVRAALQAYGRDDVVVTKSLDFRTAVAREFEALVLDRGGTS
jgi:hypothetical protein